MNCTTQSALHAARFAAGSATARRGDGHPVVSDPATWTAIVDTSRPMRFITQNGVTSRDRLLGPVRRHTHRRFSTYDTAVPHVTPTTFAVAADTPAPIASATRIAVVTIVVMTDTVRHRPMRAATG